MAQEVDMTEVKLSDTLTQYAYGPLVVEATNSDGETGHRAVYSVVMTNDANGVVVTLHGTEGSGEYVLDSPDDLDVDATASKIAFKSQGTIYTVRKFQDSDGTWASMTGAVVPAQVLEEIFMNETNADAGLDQVANFNPEELYTLANDSGEIVHLVYTGADQTFVRKDGQWAPLDDPNGDILDNLYIQDVTPAFVDYFDKKESKGLTVDDLAKYEDDTVVTASAATGFKFARVINKKD